MPSKCFFLEFLSLSSLATLTTARLLPKSSIDWVPCSENVPESTIDNGGSFDASSIDITVLPSALKCGRLDVPMDYSKPFGDSNRITLGLAVVRSPSSKGGLFFNPGGTDAGVVVAWEVALNISNAFVGLEDFDLVVMDIRGTYSSNPLNVSLDLFPALLGPYPTSQAEYDAVQETSKAIFQSWEDLSTPPGIIQHVGTREVVQDYERIREALGYETINFLGASYGGFRAGQYASTYPETVGRFVLDSTAPHGLDLFTQAQDAIAMVDRVMLRADAYCLDHPPNCSFADQGKGAIPKAFKQILAAAPYTAPECENPDFGCYTNVTAHDIQQAMLGALSGLPDFIAIFGALELALDGTVFPFFVSGPAPYDAVVAMPILANDYSFDRSFEAFNKSLTQGLASDTSGIGMSQIWQIQLWASGWPYQSLPNLPLPPLKDKILIVTPDFDGSAATEWSTHTWKHLPKSVLVVRHGDDHVSFPLVDQPSTAITKAFLNTGILPEAQDSNEVTVYMPGMTRGAVADPYEVPTGAVAGDVDSGRVVEIVF